MEQPASSGVENAEPRFPEIVVGFGCTVRNSLDLFHYHAAGKAEIEVRLQLGNATSSEYTKMFTGLAESYPPQGVTEAQRVDALMTRGNQARELARMGEVL